MDEVEWKLHEFDEGQTNYRVFSARLHCIVANGADTISFFTARNRMGHIKLLYSHRAGSGSKKQHVMWEGEGEQNI